MRQRQALNVVQVEGAHINQCSHGTVRQGLRAQESLDSSGGSAGSEEALQLEELNHVAMRWRKEIAPGGQLASYYSWDCVRSLEATKPVCLLVCLSVICATRLGLEETYSLSLSLAERGWQEVNALLNVGQFASPV